MKNDRASWSWEIRIHEKFSMTDNLLAWSCSADTLENLNNSLTDEGQTVPPPGWQTILDSRQPVIADNFFHKLNDVMLGWVAKRCKT